jgi:galactose-1-phosphate uridylyltransferase
VTPKLPPEVAAGGRICQGEAVLFPNISPYDRHSVVVVLTSTHFVPPEDFSPSQLADGLAAAQVYFRALAPVPTGTFSLVTWNYMPPAGATQVHAHLQAFSTDRPGSLLEEEVRRSRSFHRRHGKVFWESLLAEEKGRAERYLGAGRHTAWIVPFVSRSVISDVMAIFPGVANLEQVSEAALMEFSNGLCRVIAFFAGEGVVAFNLAFYPAPSGQEGDSFWLHARLSPRIYFNPSILGSDTTSWQHLLDEPFMVRSPEVLAAALRPELDGILLGSEPR